MITRNGICYDLTVSEYRCTVDGLTFVFSSKLHAEKFEKKYRENRKRINASLTNRFNISIEVNTLADIVLYKNIEKRGFLIHNAQGELMRHVCDICYSGGTVKNW